MKYFNKTKAIILFATAVAGLGIAGCRKDFLDINDNPNSVTTSAISPELIFPSAAASTGALIGSGNYDFLDNWMGYLCPDGDFTPNQEETTYGFTPATGSSTALWNSHYETLFDLYNTKTMALAKGDSVLAGVSMVLSDQLWQQLVDLFGDVPYSDAFHIERTSTPHYDKAVDIYTSLQADLDKAISYLHGTAANDFPGTVSAVVHFGSASGTPAADQVNWIHYANTLKLRMLIRTSEVSVPGINLTAELAKITANGGVLQAGQSVNVNPGYSNDVNKQSPFYGNFGFTPTGSDASSARANKYSTDTLTARNDPRLIRFYRGVGGTATSQGGAIVPCQYGLVGADPITGVGNPSGVNSSKVGFGTANTASQDQWILTSVESLFLYAEAVQRGWLTGPTPAAAYQAAVNESFAWLGVPNATTAATAYTANNSFANFANASSTLGGFTFTPVKFIAYQKYMALNQINPQESYADLRRLHMIPDNGYLSKNTARLANNLPNRLPYPQSEYTLNFANVNAEGVIDITTFFTGAKIFWQP